MNVCTFYLIFLSRSTLTITLEKKSGSLWRNRVWTALMRPRSTFTCWWRETRAADSCSQMPTWGSRINPQLCGIFSWGRRSSKHNSAPLILTICLFFPPIWPNLKVILFCMRGERKMWKIVGGQRRMLSVCVSVLDDCVGSHWRSR